MSSFSAGNTGPGLHTLNPYAVAPWVISVGATDTSGHLASFSSRGDFASALFHPTLVAPGLNVVSVRGSGIANVTGAEGVAAGADAQRLSSAELPYYTTASGTSFSAPQVAGAIALMLEANPGLNPAQVKDVLQRTATPLPPYYRHEVGAGMLNVHAAVLEAAFPARRIGAWRDTLDRGQVKFVNDAPTTFSGTVQPGSAADTTLGIPAGALLASVQISWGPLLSTNDLGLYVYDPGGSLNSQSNSINLPGLTGKREGVAVNMPASGIVACECTKHARCGHRLAVLRWRFANQPSAVSADGGPWQSQPVAAQRHLSKPAHLHDVAHRELVPACRHCHAR